MKIKITEKQFREGCFFLAKLGVKIKGKCIAHHKKDSTDPSKNWLEYWQTKKSSKLESYICPSCMKNSTDLVGGHIVTRFGTFIIPVCRECNSKYQGDNSDNHPFYVNREEMVRVQEDQ